MSSIPSTQKLLGIEVKNYANADVKVFQSCPILLIFFILFQMFCPGFWMMEDLSGRFEEVVMAFFSDENNKLSQLQPKHHFGYPN